MRDLACMGLGFVVGLIAHWLAAPLNTTPLDRRRADRDARYNPRPWWD